MLTAAQKQSFADTGHLVLPSVLGGDLLRRLTAEYETVLDAVVDRAIAVGELSNRPEGDFLTRLRSVHQAGVDWFQSLDISLPNTEITADTPFHIGPAVFELMTSRVILDTVESLIGDEIVSNPIQHIRLKPPAGELAADENRAHVGLTAWHQDRGVAHAEADQTEMVTVWVAVTEATVENGCLVVIPGPVNDGLLEHCPAGQTHIPDTLLDADRATALPVPAGSLVLLHPSIPHASLPNTSDVMRWSFDLRYHKRGDASGRAHFPSFVVRSRSHDCVADWQAMHTAWADARADLARRPHIELHRWDGDAPVCA